MRSVCARLRSLPPHTPYGLRRPLEAGRAPVIDRGCPVSRTIFFDRWGFKVTKQHKPPIADLIDELGQIRLEMAALADREKRAKDALAARGIAEGEGRVFRLTTTSTIRWSLDQKLVKTEMGQDWFDRHSRQSVVVSVRTTPRAEAVAELSRAA
jgi:hypothetical protein